MVDYVERLEKLGEVVKAVPPSLFKMRIWALESGCGTFPSVNQRHYEPTPGMSLLDWFAGQATDADVDEYRECHVHPDSGRVIYTTTRTQARYAYARAMLAERAKSQSGENHG